MTSYEGFGDREGRGSHARAAESEHRQQLADEVAGEKRESLYERRRAIQARLAQLESDLQRGNERAASVTDEALKTLFIKVGRDTARQIEELSAEEAELDKEIQIISGNPGRRTGR